MRNKPLANLPLSFCILLTSFMFTGCTDPSSPNQIAQNAFDAWAKGENTGNYSEFKALLDSGFVQYSHPLAGAFTGGEAYRKMKDLIADREKNPNHLKFSEVSVLSNKEQVGFSFRSEGIVGGGFPYKGFNLIVFTVRNGKIIGFNEYFGIIDPAWFKQ